MIVNELMEKLSKCNGIKTVVASDGKEDILNIKSVHVWSEISDDPTNSPVELITE
jgi:hypothetical protein